MWYENCLYFSLMNKVGFEAIIMKNGGIKLKVTEWGLEKFETIKLKHRAFTITITSKLQNNIVNATSLIRRHWRLGFLTRLRQFRVINSQC